MYILYTYYKYIVLHLVAATVLIFFKLHLNNVGFNYTLIIYRCVYIYIYKYT